MSDLTEAQKQEIIAALEKAGAKLPCPRCDNRNFTLLDGYFNQPVQTELAGLVLGGPTVPSVVVVCKQCGFMSQHAMGVLGLMKPAVKEEVGK